ncbi:unnamed protein product, partial [Cyprideis torosa]
EATSSVGYSYDRVDTSRAVPHGGPTGFEDEPPLLEELGINPEHIMQKTLAVLHPFKKTDATILQDTDMAGPIAFGLAFGAFLLISGKVHFGYIYGIGLVGCLGIYFLLNMMSIQGISLGITASILGYCLLPMVALAGFAILFSLKGGIGLVTTIASVVWCSWSASKLFVTALAMDQQQPLVAYPCALLNLIRSFSHNDAVVSLVEETVFLMANKAKELQRLDAEIERCREEGEWRRLLELSMSRRSKISFGRVSPMEEALTDFLVGEARLEAFLVEYPPTEENIAIACRELHEPKRLLSDCLGDAGQKAGVALDAKLLLGKLAFAEGDYDAAINCFTEAKLRSLKEKALAIRAMKMTAESFAVLGMSLEKVPPSSNSRFRVSERQEEVIACFDRASDLGLLFAQQTAHMEASGSSLGLLLESAITRAPVLLVTAGQLDRALSRFRATLSAVEMGTNSQRLRLAMFQSFGKFLLRGFCQANYSQPKPPAETSTSVSRWQPKRHLSSWIPRSVHEETILVILLAEAMAVREAVLSRSSDARVEEARTHSLKTAFTVHDLLTIALVRWREPSVIVEALERHLKFAFEETHIWGQYAMALSTLGKHARALRALEETMRIDPNDSLTRLLAA